MLKPPVPRDEKQRLENLKLYNILDSGAEKEFDDVTLLASQICQTPISLISLIDQQRQWFKSAFGLNVSQVDRNLAFCGHAILGSDVFIVPDALKDERFADHPCVTQQPAIRFYAATPLISSEGYALGTLCVIDRVPRELSSTQIQALTILGRQVVSLINLRRAVSISRAAEAEIKLIANRLSLATQSAKIGVWDWDLKSNVLTWDATMFEHYGLKQSPDSRVEYSVWSSAVVPEDLARQESILRDTVARRGRSEREFRIRRGDGKVRVIHAAEVVVLDDQHKPARVVGVNRDVTDAREAEAKIRHMSLHDALTGLPNRLLFVDRVDQALLRLKRDPAAHFAVIFVDLDRFKVINDGVGHAAGDELLKTIANRLMACLRRTDSLSRPIAGNSDAHAPLGDAGPHTVARMGGDEFTLILDGLRRPADATIVAERLLTAIAQPINFNGHEMRMAASIGIVNASASYENSQELLRDADSAMYVAKSTGKARYVVFDSTMREAAVSRMELEADLRLALEQGQLTLHYQPVLSIKTRELKAFEALVRWPRADKLGNRTMVPPENFIPMAEDTGLIVPLGNWVLRAACQQMAAWKQTHPLAAQLTIAINVSGKQLVDHSYVKNLRRVLQETRLDPKSICLEITESVLMDERNDPAEKLAELKAAGVLLAMDDFGTGYSSLSCLHRFPIDILKVDRSFIQNMKSQPHAASVVEAVIKLAHKLGLEVVAEGVEMPEQLALLHSLGCNLMQGFLFSEPLTADAAGRLMLKRRAWSKAS
jgi:PAS domain S-box-containing protein